jgi:hypothetical protein
MKNSQPKFTDEASSLTKREYFAVKAMQGLLAANATYGNKTDNRSALAKDAILFADALLKELDNTK